MRQQRPKDKEGWGTHSTLWHDVVRIRLAETSTLQEVHDVGLCCCLLVERILVLLETDGSTEDDLWMASREPVVAVIEDDLHYMP